MIFRRRQKHWYLIAGLGNPGRSYRKNRHNVGFMFLDFLVDEWGLRLSQSQSKALITTTEQCEKDIILAKPQTFMNQVGQSIAALCRFYKVPPERLLVIYDDLDLPTGVLRMRPFGGAGGHRGMRSIIQQSGSSDFPRLRIGIGRPQGRMEPADYVLQDFNADEKALIDIALRSGFDCLTRFLSEGIEIAMTFCNSESEDM